MIRRQDKHDGRVIATRDPSRAERHRRRGIAFRRLGDDVFLRETAQQLSHGGFLFHIR
jgi:hypothetical protein